MIYNEKDVELQAALNAATQMCAAARTAPKACGIDHLHTMILTGGDLAALADELERMGNEQGRGFYIRDAGNLRASLALVLVGTTESQRGLGECCGYCHFRDCGECAEGDGTCVFDAMDLGIALGSAAALAADLRVDTRMLFTAGKAALSMKLFDESVKIVIGIPISISGKSPFFDRTRKA